KTTIGAAISARTRPIVSSADRRLPPAASARSVARWMTGPSASGSENGTPTSSTSAPARSSAFRISAERARSGSPAVTYVTRPGRPSRLSRANVSAMLGIEQAFDGVHVLVTTAREVDEKNAGRSKFASERLRIGDRVSRFQRGQNALEPGQRLERRERIGVGHVRIFGSTERTQPRVFGTDRRIVQARRNRMRQVDIPVIVLEDVGPRALQDAGAAACEARGMSPSHDRL